MTLNTKGNIDKINTMFDLQYDLNNETNGNEWITGVTKDGRDIDWDLCISQETAELIDSIKSWKHWKDLNAPTDYENLKMEVVDIWHFLTGEIITRNGGERVVITKISTPILDRYARDYINLNIPLNINNTDIKKLANLLRTDIISKARHLSYIVTHTKLSITVETHTDSLLLQFMMLLYASGMTIDDLYSMYIVKNTLNRFRQNNGYKDGTYVKVIDGKEDNEHMMMFMNNSKKQLTADDLYVLYEDFYKAKA